MYKALLKRLSELMVQRNLTKNGLANISGVPPTTVRNIFDGKSQNPGIVTIKLLCDGMGITITEFFNSPIFEELEIEDIK